MSSEELWDVIWKVWLLTCNYKKLYLIKLLCLEVMN